MASKRKHLRNRRPLNPRNPGLENATDRNVYLDSLRGLAIILMIVDHAAGILLAVPIEYSTLRFVTRLSMPLFAILMGYFFIAKEVPVNSPWRERYPVNRLLQIFAAAIATNALYYSHYRVLDILASLSICSACFLLLRSKFVFLIAAILLYKNDLTGQVFDYPLTIVLSLVAQGMLLRKMGLGPALIAATALTLIGIEMVGKPSLFVLLFAFPATLLIGLASQNKGLSSRWLRYLGRYPLTIYVVQYYIIFGIAQCMSVLSN